MLINASSRMNLSNGLRLPSSSRMNFSNGVRLRSSSHPCKSTHDVGVFYRSLDYGLSRVIEGHKPVLPIRCLGQTDGVSDADFYEHFETWCKKYGKTYSSEEHKRYRFKLFKENYPIKPPHNNYLSLQMLNENSNEEDHPNNSSHPLTIEEAIQKYGYGLCPYEYDFLPAPQPGTMYLYNNGNPLIPLDSDLAKYLQIYQFFERIEMDGDNLNSWKMKVTEESMSKGKNVLNFPKKISKRFLIDNPPYMNVIDQEFGVHFPCEVKSSGGDVNEKFLCEGWDDFLRAKRVKEGDTLIFPMSKNGGMMLVQKNST
ncbi:putative transcription factor B3-Domain family [Medicago truncatula]|uniref:Cathepsin propeptide inhibitor domain protein n=2 Tax=Medicago truncatula TaxID=3880 RepID=G7KPD8_MEDTR|nr:cathepsin propeptide inhibitor domain protein [Medicago truncatula]RHN52927.1 putative transcription factor B3-Domain family [Medicago truncatula]